mgnify:CR=1 FL=1
MAKEDLEAQEFNKMTSLKKGKLIEIQSFKNGKEFDISPISSDSGQSKEIIEPRESHHNRMISLNIYREKYDTELLNLDFLKEFDISDYELMIIKNFMEFKTTKDIALDLDRARPAIDHIFKVILRKLALKNRMDLRFLIYLNQE